MSNEEKWIYTPWGYGKILEQSRSKVSVKLHWNGVIYTSPSAVSLSIHFSVKIFSAARKCFPYEWSLYNDFSLLFTLLAKQISLPPNMVLTLYYPKGRLLKLLPSDSPISLKLKTNTKFIAIVKQGFTWDPSKKSANIELLDDQLTVRKKDSSEILFETVLGTIQMNTGHYHWEIKLDFLMHYEEEEEIFIGVANKGTDLRKVPFDCEYWGFMCMGGQKFGPGCNEEYGESVTTGDVLGIKLEYKDGKGLLSFSKNGNEFGIAFSEVPIGVYPAVTLNYPKMQISLGKPAEM